MRQMRAATLTGYIEVARHVGLDPYELLRQAGISPNFLDDPEKSDMRPSRSCDCWKNLHSDRDVTRSVF